MNSNGSYVGVDVSKAHLDMAVNQGAGVSPTPASRRFASS